MSTADYVALNGNAIIDDAQELLLRQVHPAQMQDSKPTSQAFEATKDHGFLLSTKRGAFGEEEAYRAHLERGLRSCGTWGVTVGAAADAAVPAVDDAVHVGEEGHASLSYLDHESRGKRTQSARKLRDAATCLFVGDADAR